MTTLGDADRRLLRQMQADPDAPLGEIAARAGMSTAVASRRVAALRAAGVIRAIVARVDWRAMGYDVEVSLRITLDKSQPRAFEAFAEAARQVPEVLEIQSFVGKVDIRLKVIARDMAHWHDLYRRRILALPHITDIEALMHVATLKSEGALPL